MPDEDWLAIDPVVIPLVALAVLVLLTSGRRLLAAGLLIALGIESATLWLRYLGVPIIAPDYAGSFGVGAAAGLAGGLLILAAGLLVWRSEAASPAARCPPRTVVHRSAIRARSDASRDGARAGLQRQRRFVMTTIELQRTGAELGTTTYRAAVVHEFAGRFASRTCRAARSSRARSSCGSRRRASATPTSTPPTATGRSSRSPPFVPGHEGVGIVEERRRRRHRGRRRRPRRDAVARLRLRGLRLLRLRLGDALPRAEEHGLLDRRRLRRVRRRRTRATSSRCPRASIRSTPRR